MIDDEDLSAVGGRKYMRAAITADRSRNDFADFADFDDATTPDSSEKRCVV